MPQAINRARKALVAPIPAPVGGLNARDSLASMPSQDASVMENLFPYADRVGTRPGFAVHGTATAIGTIIEGIYSLMKWSGTGGNEQLFAAYFYATESGGNRWGKVRILSVSTAGVFATAVTHAGTTGDYHLGEWTQFTSGSGTKYLLAPWTFDDRDGGSGLTAFGIDAYDGASWTTPTITNVPAFTAGIHSHRNRLWFYGATDTVLAKPLSVWYLPVGAVSGAAVEFNVGSYATKGGQIVAMRTWTLDGGTGGSDDLAVFITDKGQAIVYAGTDPSSSSTWQLVGSFDIGRASSPTKGFITVGTASGGSRAGSFNFVVRDDFALKQGGDVWMWTENGIETALKSLRGADGDKTISGKINPLLADAYKSYGAPMLGVMQWHMVAAPFLKSLLISVPALAASSSGSAPASQVVTTTLYAMNLDTGAWTKYSGINFADAILWNSSIYFVDGSRTVYKIDGTAVSDNSTAITYEVRQAYNYLNSPENKNITLMQPVMQWTGNFSLTAEIDVNYSAGTISAYTSYAVSGTQSVTPWLSSSAYGRACAIHMKGQTSVGAGSWYATNIAYKPCTGIP